MSVETSESISVPVAESALLLQQYGVGSTPTITFTGLHTYLLVAANDDFRKIENAIGSFWLQQHHIIEKFNIQKLNHRVKRLKSPK